MSEQELEYAKVRRDAVGAIHLLVAGVMTQLHVVFEDKNDKQYIDAIESVAEDMKQALALWCGANQRRN